MTKLFFVMSTAKIPPQPPTWLKPNTYWDDKRKVNYPNAPAVKIGLQTDVVTACAPTRPNELHRKAHFKLKIQPYLEGQRVEASSK